MQWVVVVCAVLVTVYGAVVSEQAQLPDRFPSLPEALTTSSASAPATVTLGDIGGPTSEMSRASLHPVITTSATFQTSGLSLDIKIPSLQTPSASLGSPAFLTSVASHASPTTQASLVSQESSMSQTGEKEVSEAAVSSVPPTLSVSRASTVSQPSTTSEASQASQAFTTFPVPQELEQKKEISKIPESSLLQTTRTFQESSVPPATTTPTLPASPLLRSLMEMKNVSQAATSSLQPQTAWAFQESPISSTPSSSQVFPVVQALVGRIIVSEASTPLPVSTPLPILNEYGTSLNSPQTDQLMNEFSGVNDEQLAPPGSFKEYSESSESLESQESNDLLTPLGASKVSAALEASDTSEASEESWMEGEEDVEIPWPWMLFVLSGNTKVANRRQRDLGTYLRLNLAARLDADYNDVAINRILLTQDSILANISVEPSHLVGTGAVGLETLGQGNVTLLELSGHEFTVDRIIRVTELVDQRYPFLFFFSCSSIHRR